MIHSIRSIRPIILSAALAGSAGAAPILVDFGVSTETTGTDSNGRVWNNVSSSRLVAADVDPSLIGSPRIAELVDVSGAGSGVSLKAEFFRTNGALKISGSAVDADGGAGTSPSGIVHVESAANDSLFVNSKNDPDRNYYLLTLGGLTGAYYDLHFLCAAEGGNDNGSADFTVTGATSATASVSSNVMLVAEGNDDLSGNFASVTGMAPDASGEIRIRFTSAAVLASGNSNARWNTLEISPGEAPPPVPVIRSFTAEPATIRKGGQTTLSWDVENADAIVIDQGIGDVTNLTAAGAGALTAAPAETTTFTLTATNADGPATATTTITVSGTMGSDGAVIGEAGILYVSGDIDYLTQPPDSLRAGQVESADAIRLITEKQAVSLDSAVEVDYLVKGPATVTGGTSAAGALPLQTPLNSYYFHADLPAGTPERVFAATVTFDNPIIGLAYQTRTSPSSGAANRLEETDAVFGLPGMLFEDEALHPDSYLRRSANGEAVDEFSIDASGLTLTVVFRLDSANPRHLDSLRVITRADALPPPPSHPNILIFLADDMGIGDTSAYQDWSGVPDASQIATPAMERLADLGIRFTDAHSQNRCSPTRYALLTGRYAWRAGMLTGVLYGVQVDPLIEKGRPTLPSFLKTQGYHTGLVGKWHLGLNYRQGGGGVADGWSDAELRRPLADGPLDHGFNFFYGVSRSHATSGPDGMTGNTANQAVGPGWIDHRRVVGATDDGKRLDGTYVLNDYGQLAYDKAIGFLNDHLGNATTAQRPFFLHFCSPSNHEPYTPNHKINGIPIIGASQWKDGNPTRSARSDFILMNDVILAELIRHLETTDDPRSPGAKLLDNTLILFTSDNGAEIDSRIATGNLRGFKARIYEGGHRVPFIAYWKNGGVGNGTEGNGGITTDEPIAMQDLYPTIAGILGEPLPPPDSGNAAAVDGFSRLNALRNQPGPPRPPLMINEQNGSRWMSLYYTGNIPLDPPRPGRWKIIFDSILLNGAATGTGTANAIELYDLGSDPRETNNLLNHQANAELVDKLSRWAENIVNSQASRRPLPRPGLEIDSDETGMLELEFDADSFFHYQLFRSENLVQWNPVDGYFFTVPTVVVAPRSVEKPREFFRLEVHE